MLGWEHTLHTSPMRFATTEVTTSWARPYPIAAKSVQINKAKRECAKVFIYQQNTTYLKTNSRLRIHLTSLPQRSPNSCTSRPQGQGNEEQGCDDKNNERQVLSHHWLFLRACRFSSLSLLFGLPLVLLSQSGAELWKHCQPSKPGQTKQPHAEDGEHQQCPTAVPKTKR